MATDHTYQLGTLHPGPIRDLVARAWDLELTDPARGRAFAEEAIAIARASGDREGLAASLLAAGWACYHLTEATVALGYFNDAADLFAALADPGGRARSLRGSGTIYHDLGDVDQALIYFEQALALYRAAGDQIGFTRNLNCIANAYNALERYAEAIAQYAEALPLARAQDDARTATLIASNLGLTHAQLGEALIAQGDAITARAHFRAAVTVLDETLAELQVAPQPMRESYCLRALARAWCGLGDYDQAQALLARALALPEVAFSPRLAALYRAQVGELYHQQGQHEQAVAHLLGVLPALEELGLRGLVAEALRYMALAYEALEDHRQALAAFRRYHTIDIEVRTAAADNRARILRVQLSIDQARREAETERRRAAELTVLNEQLQIQARQLEYHAYEDGLTKLANRRLLEQTLAAQFAHSRAHRTSLAVALMDVDHFKGINDRYSHLVGDEVLKAIGQILPENCRAHDLAARYGGEEFALVFPECNGADAAIVCERLRLAIAGYDWSRLHPDLRVTVSLGYSDDPEVATPQVLLAAADAQLYHAKMAGRNRVYPAPGPDV